MARLGDEGQLATAGADLVVTTLDDVSVPALGEGRLQERRAAAEIRRRRTERPPSVWTLVYDGFDPEHQGLRETLCALGNGYFVTRGALPEAQADDVNYPGTYVAGLYNRLVSDVAGRQVENEDLVNVPNWLPLQFRIAGGPWFDLQREQVEGYRSELDMRNGTLTRRFSWRDGEGRRTRVVQRRFVSRRDQHLAGLETQFTAENWSGDLEVRSGLDGGVVNAGVKRYRDLNGRHLRTLGHAQVDMETVDLQSETTQSRVRVALAARTRLLRDGEPAEVDRQLVEEPGFVAQQLTARLEQDRPATVEKIVALYTSGPRNRRSRHDAQLALAGADDFATLLARHERAWLTAWDRFDIAMDSANEWTETVPHLHLFHLLQTVSPRTAIGCRCRPELARGGCRGHIFWDELFIFPYINYQGPSLAGVLRSAALRLGRPRRRHGRPDSRVPCSRGRAAQQARGAQRSISTPSPAAGCRPLAPAAPRQHRHRATSVALLGHRNIVSAFHRRRAARRNRPVLVQHRHVQHRTEPLRDHGVMGPDEYHEGCPDSDEAGCAQQHLYDIMVAWLLRRALEALEELPPHYGRSWSTSWRSAMRSWTGGATLARR